MNYKYTQVVKYGLKAQKLLAQGSALGYYGNQQGAL